MRISDIRGSNGAVLDHVVAHHRFEVSIKCMEDHSLGFTRNFGCGNIFLVEPFKYLPDGLYEGHILFFLVSICGRHI